MSPDREGDDDESWWVYVGKIFFAVFLRSEPFVRVLWISSIAMKS